MIMKWDFRLLILSGMVSAVGTGLVADVGGAAEQKDELGAGLLEVARKTFGRVEEVTEEEIQQEDVELGRQLFWDERLSGNGKVACASCHAAADWGADSNQFSLDANDRRTKRNSQTVFNALLQPGLRWTADRKSGAHQAERSLTGSMGFLKAVDVVPLLVKHGYAPMFEKVFPEDTNPVTPQNYANAIEAYEATLRTPAPFDKYLAGDASALGIDQKKGLHLFIYIGCADCHGGKLLGGEQVTKFGIYEDYWTLTGSERRDDGLFETSKKEEERYHFRVAMLRNIEKTGPYFHDGSVADLKKAIRIMAKGQLDRDMEDAEVESIVAFLKSLTGEVPRNYRK